MTQTKGWGFGVGLTTPHSSKIIVTKVEKRKSWMDLMMMERVGDRQGKMEGYCSTGQSRQRAVVPMEEEEEEEKEEEKEEYDTGSKF
jgi:hypothetical protein